MDIWYPDAIKLQLPFTALENLVSNEHNIPQNIPMARPHSTTVKNLPTPKRI